MQDDASSLASWAEWNASGIALASQDAWPRARAAFQRSADALSGIDAPSVATHDAMALVLGNLAQACFRTGDLDDAIRHAQRGCALRVALVGEDAVAVARARSDLAVMLAAAGRIEESPALLARAIAGIEQSVGDEDARLGIVLENAARTALASGQPATAEPHLIRLHALLAANDMSTHAADVLVARVMTAREQAAQRHTPAAVEPVTVPATNDAEADHASADHASAGDASAPHALADHAAFDDASAGDEWDDQPLRDAVVLTDVLLRTTPTGNVAIRPPDEEPAEKAIEDATREAHAAEHDDEASVFGDSELELIDFEPTASDVAVSHSAALTEPFVPETDDAAPAGGLGFVVEYGIPRDTASQRAIPDRPYEPPAIRSSDAITREAQDQAAFDPDDDQSVDVLTPPGAVPSIGIDAEFELVPETPPTPAEASAPIAPPAADAYATFIERRKTPRSVSVAMPSPAGGASVIQSTMADDREERAPVSRPTVNGMDAVGASDGPSTDNRTARPAPRVTTRIRKEPVAQGNGRGIAIGGAVALAAAAAAGWFFLRGGM